MSKIGQVNKMNKLLAATIGMFLVFRGVIAIADPLFETSFEEGKNINDYISSGWSSSMPFNNIKYWPAGVEVELDGGVCHLGKRSLRLCSPSENRLVSMGTPSVAVEPDTRVRVSIWMKLEDVICGAQSWYTARMCVHVLDNAGSIVTGGTKVIATDMGTRGWTKYEAVLVIPSRGTSLRMWCELKNCKGTAWFDDLKVETLDDKPLLQRISANKDVSLPAPVVIPRPWKEHYGASLFQMETVRLEIPSKRDAVVSKELNAFIKEMDGKTVSDKASEDYQTLLFVGSPDNPKIKEYLLELGISIKWKDLKDQGYLLYAGKYRDKRLILLVSPEAEGRFYAFQTLRQITISKDGKKFINEARIIDRPLYPLRGSVGMLGRWYEGASYVTNKLDDWPYRERFHSLKLNFVFVVNILPRECQVMPFSEGYRRSALSFLEDCRKYFITPSIGVSPYRQLPHPGREKGGVIYSSEQDIQGTVDNLASFYDIGYRHLYLAFDDLPAYRFLEYEEDKAKFKTIAEAHLYFVGEVYRRLMKRCPEVKFRFLGVAYDGAENMPQDRKEYCRGIAGLPKEIEFVWTGSKSSDAQYYSGLNGDRKLMIWSNYYAGLYEKLTNIPVFEYPYRGGDASFHKHTTGHFFLPVDNAGSANLSWYTAADYMWNPEGYNPDDSAGRAMIKAVGKELYQLLPDYISLINGLTGNKGIPGFTSEERMTNLSRAKERLDSYMAEFEKLAGNEIYDALTKQARDLYADFNLLLEQYKTKPLPIIAKKAGMSPVIDGKLDDKCWKDAAQISDFLVLGRNIPAEVQTKVFLLYDEKNLYLGAVMFEPDIRKLKRDFKERDSAVFRDDSFEVFIGDVNALKNYYHIALNSTGAIYDAYLDKSEWNGKYSSATMVAEDCWTVEMAIPWTNFNFASKDRLSCNFARARRTAKTELTAYAPLLGTGNHLPHWFWTLKLQ